MLKIGADVAWDDYCNFFELNQKKLIKMVHDLIKDIEVMVWIKVVENQNH